MNDNFIPDALPSHDIEARQLLRANQSEAEDHSERLRKLEAKVEKLSLLNESLWLLLTQRTKLSDADMVAAISATQQQRQTLQDAKLTCIKCNMQNTLKQKKCIYCGGELRGHPSTRPFSFE